MAQISSRLADDLALAKKFTKNKDFKQWEKEFTARQSKQATNRNLLMDSATTAARRVKESADAYSSNNGLYSVFLEGIQYGYHDNGDWEDSGRPKAASSSTLSVLGHLQLSGKNENVLEWKRSLGSVKEKEAGRSGYTAGSNLRKNVDSVAKNRADLVDYFTVFSLEYQYAHTEQNSIGDILTDITRATANQFADDQSDAIDKLARQTAKQLVFFFKTHPYAEYQTFLKGFNTGYSNPGAMRNAKRDDAREGEETTKRVRRIASLYSDIEDSQQIELTGIRHDQASVYGESLGKRFRRQLALEEVDGALVLLSKYYDEELVRFAAVQKYPIVAKATTAFAPLFFNNVDLTANLTGEEFALVFADAENTIDASSYRPFYDAPTWPRNVNDRINIIEQLFSSSYGVYAMNKNGEPLLRLVEKILSSSSVKVLRTMDLTTDEIDLIARYMLPRSESIFDDEYQPSSAQRELDSIRACEFYVQASILLGERPKRDVETLILTPLLVNVMADYVKQTSSLDSILAVYPEKTPLNARLRNFLELYVAEKNRQWALERVKIAKSVLFSKNFTEVTTNVSAAEIAFYLNDTKLSTSAALFKKITQQFRNVLDAGIDESVAEDVYFRTASNFGLARFLELNTSSTFGWLRLSNNAYMPNDISDVQQVVHDVILFRHLQQEMKERAAMVSTLLFFENGTSFNRWELVNFLAKIEDEEMSARQTVEFTQTASQLVSMFGITEASIKVADDDDDIREVFDRVTNLPSKVRTQEDLADVKFYDNPVTDDQSETSFRSSSASRSSGSDWDIVPFGDDNFSPVAIGAKMTASRPRCPALTARTRGAVIRPVLPNFFRASCSSRDKDDTEYFGAFKDHAFGEKIGCAVYSRRCKKLLALEARDTEQVEIGSLLKDYIYEKYPDANLSEPIGDSVGGSLVNFTQQLFDLVLDITVNYRPVLAGSGREQPHGIFFYPSYSYAPSEPVFVAASDAINGKRVKMAYKVVRDCIPGHAMFNVDSYARYTDSSDECGVNQSGFAACRLMDLSRSGGTKLSLVVPNSDEKRAKGEVLLTVHSVSLPLNATPSVSSSRALSEERSSIQAQIRRYISMNKKFYRTYPNSASSVQNITVFEYACRDGIIPGSMFDSFKLAPSDEKFYLQVLMFAVARRRPDIDMNAFAVDDWIAFDEQDKIVLLMDVLRMYVNYCPYIRDIADNNVEGKTWSKRNIELIESFDYIRQRDAGDCEDFTREIIQSAMEIKYNLKYSQSAAVQEMRRLASMFVFASVLCGVSREAMSLDELSRSNVRLHGHECAVAIPNYIFFEALKRHDADNVLMSLHTEEEMSAGATQKIFILEGTGCLFPEPREKTSQFESIQHAFSSKCKEVARHSSDMVFYDPRRDNTFYKQMISILTPEFFLRTGHTGFEFLVCRKTPSGTFRGVPFSLLLDIHANQDVMIIPAPVIPADVFHAASRMDDDNFPPISLHRGAMTSEMRDVCASLTTRRPRRDEDFFQFQIRFQNMSLARQQKIKDFAAAQKLNVLCLAEPVKMSASTTDCIGGYTIFLF